MMRIKWLITGLKVALPLVVVLGLAGCDNTNVYGSVGVGVSSSGFNGHGSNNRRMHGSISVGGRIR